MFERLVDLIRDRSGNVMFIATLSLPILIGAGGLATDTVQWTLWQKEMQRQADSAALAGAFAKAQGADPIANATTDINRYTAVTLSAGPTIENAPTTGSYAGNSNAVRVVLQTGRKLPFSSLFLASAPTLRAEATAAVISNGNYCVIAFETMATAGVTMQGNATVNMGCGIATNSTASNAVVAGGSSSIYATPVSAVGGLQSSSNYASGTVLLPHSINQQDPFASLPTPVVPPGCSNQLNVAPNAMVDVANPTGVACYRGMNIKGTTTFAPGVYIIDGNAFSASSQAAISGTGVTFVLTSNNATSNPSSIATLDMNGGANVQLTAPTSGPYQGVLIYQDRRAVDSGTNTINGNASSKLQGAVYMPSQAVSFSGGSGMNTQCIQIATRRVTFIGNNNIVNNCPSGSGSSAFTGTRVQLVG
jgi:hypothetical protein